VTCTSTTNCTAVGSISRSGKSVTLVESWNGTAWKLVSSQNQSAATQNSLRALACLTATNCAAGGLDNAGNDFLAEHWNGTAWSIVAMPTLGFPWPGVLGLACAPPSTCVAVTRFGSGHGNGSTWSSTAMATVPGSNQTEFSGGVTCTAPTACTAVGDWSSTGPVYHTLVEAWNGSTWKVVASPNPPG
jgi:hypothetical protein